jgi:IS30 family transposase
MHHSTMAPRLTQQQRQDCFRLYKQNKPINWIAKHLRCTRNTIKRWVGEGQKRKPKWMDAVRRGRVCKLSSAERAKVKRQARALRTVPDITAALMPSQFYTHSSRARGMAITAILGLCVASALESVHFLNPSLRRTRAAIPRVGHHGCAPQNTAQAHTPLKASDGGHSA